MQNIEKSSVTEQVEMAKTLSIIINDLREVEEAITPTFLLEMLAIAGLKLANDGEALDAVQAFEFSSTFGI